MAQAFSTTSNPSFGLVDHEEALPSYYLIEYRGVAFRVQMDHNDDELIPRRFLAEAELSEDFTSPPWIHRALQTMEQGSLIRMAEWNRLDTKYKEVFENLVRIPLLRDGLFDGGHEVTGQPTDDQPLLARESRRFRRIVKRQQRAIVTFMQDILKDAPMTHTSPDGQSEVYLNPKYLQKRIRYWMGRIQHRERLLIGPETNAFLTVDSRPGDRVWSRHLVPITVTTNPNVTVRTHLTRAVKTLIGQYCYQLRDVSNNIQSLPDQEAYLIHIHGSHLHILRLIAPGFKTSRIRSNVHKQFVYDDTYTSLNPHQADQLALRILANSDGDPDALRKGLKDRSVRKVLEQVEWFRLYCGDATVGTVEEIVNCDPTVFQVLVSREYDLWDEEGFRKAVRNVRALYKYLMSGTARIGSLQKMFWDWPKAAADDDDDYDEMDFAWFWDSDRFASGSEENTDDEESDYENLEKYEAELEGEAGVDETVYGSEDNNEELAEDLDDARDAILE
ncbi:uncharacterized protein BP01DRAFT_411287 [Aspergillus saccharolyticus JOP 1030-1]|uniref:Uncharacterized protein n=1 Tax=Aspergillus saccharolyticus JOP 1030-1 TaxID=1450539 RepID=A0A318ZI22_9EURO|nr:hypothetical protein BP01DRAFT_411287 [Aspergillus saccharolyticus JOP 1030-1]PYH47206.1 hypothetical protein BP01DRAFT_411287 [Aspergillus saccharolyticus JOP 1030-1]